MHYCDDMHIYSNANWLLRSVQRIVVPVTLSVNVSFRWELFVNLNVLRHPIFIWLKLYFNIYALIFYLCEGLSQPIAKCKNYGINIFDYEGHNLWHTRYKCNVFESATHCSKYFCKKLVATWHKLDYFPVQNFRSSVISYQN